MEAARTLGNLSKSTVYRAELVRCHLPEMLVLLLDHGSFAVVAAAAGTLVNLARDRSLAANFEAAELLPRIMQLLELASEPVTHVACGAALRTLYNLIVVGGAAVPNLGRMLERLRALREELPHEADVLEELERKLAGLRVAVEVEI